MFVFPAGGERTHSLTFFPQRCVGKADVVLSARMLVDFSWMPTWAMRNACWTALITCMFLKGNGGQMTMNSQDTSGWARPGVLSPGIAAHPGRCCCDPRRVRRAAPTGRMAFLSRGNHGSSTGFDGPGCTRASVFRWDDNMTAQEDRLCGFSFCSHGSVWPHLHLIGRPAESL